MCEREMESGGNRDESSCVVVPMEVVVGENNNKKEKWNKYAAACAVIASMISVLLGYDTGVMSGATIFIKEDLGINDTQIQILNGILNLFALVGSVAAGRTSDKIGRRYTIVLASFIFFIGAIMMGVARSFGTLLAGRCVAGTGVGFALMIAPVYAAEISSPSHRGSLTSLPEICISFGILLGYISNFAFAKLPLVYGWRSMLGLGAIPSLALMLGIFIMPESPRWLVMRGRIVAARSVLMKVSNTKEEAQTRLQEIKLAAGIDENYKEDNIDMTKLSNKNNNNKVLKELLLTPSPPVKRILIAAMGIHFFEHATGIEAVVLYSPRIFQKAGIQTKTKLLLATVGVGLTKTIFILVATLFIDRVGRRPLLLTSTAGMVTSLTGLGLALTMAEAHTNHSPTWALSVSVGALLSFVGFFSVGLGPITWVYSSEIFPMRLRAQGASMGVAVNRVMNATVSMTFVSVYKAITIGVLGWLFFYFFLPETKGTSLEEMEGLFGGQVQKGGCWKRRVDATTTTNN